MGDPFGHPYSHLCGWVPDPVKTAAFVASLPTPMLPARMLAEDPQTDICLLDAVLHVKSGWRRGKQTIGDCVSWGAEGACTTLEACQAVTGDLQWIEEVNTEGIYGDRVLNGDGGQEDGWFGSGAAKQVVVSGFSLKQDYSTETGIKEHDMRVYDGQKAKSWGYYGPGGKSDTSKKFQLIQKRTTVKDTTLIKTVEEAAAAIQHGCPVTVASDVGYGDMQRDSQGVVRASGQWGHQMCFIGVHYIGGKPYLQIMQSWGDSCTGPFPGVDSDAVKACTWLCHPDDAGNQIGQGDSFAYSAVQGFVQPLFDWTNPII